MDLPRKNQSYDLTIEGYASDGQGIARLNGMAVFVKGALRGEVCRVSLMKVGKTAAWGRVTEVLSPSPMRQAPDCPHYPKCGGCALRHMRYEEELSFKRQRVDDALARIGGLDLRVEAIHGAASPFRYRNKAQFPVANAPDGVRVGFYRARSHDVIDVPECLLLSPAADAAGRAVKAWMRQYGVPAYDEAAHTGLVRHVFVRTSRAGASLVCIVANGDALPEEAALVSALRAAVPGLSGVVFNANTRRTNVILGDSYRTLWGADTLDETLCGLTFRISVPSFFQVNPVQTEVLYGRAVDLAELTGQETVLDLYCGAGTISLAMARSAGRVIGAEIIPSAVENARENARRNDLHNAEFICADAGQAAQELAARGLHPDVICVDPPRKGLSPQVIEAIVQMAPRRIVYVSCDPATLARDLKLLTEHGYRPLRAEAVDMFPRTSHVETAVSLVREKVR